jgi:hypothetical protein
MKGTKADVAIGHDCIANMSRQVHGVDGMSVGSAHVITRPPVDVRARGGVAARRAIAFIE